LDRTRGQQPTGQLSRRELDSLGAILPRSLELHGETPVFALGYAAASDRGPRQVLDQAVQFVARSFAHTRIRMKTVPVKISAISAVWPRDQAQHGPLVALAPQSLGIERPA